MSNYYNPRNSGPHKDLPPVPPQAHYDTDYGYQGGFNQHGGGYGGPSANANNLLRPNDNDFNFVDPNAHIDNSFKDNSFQPANPNLSLNNRVIYDYDTDGDSDSGFPHSGPSANNNGAGAINNLGTSLNPSNQRELAKAHQNDFYSQSNNSGISRHSSTKSNPFKEDPFTEISPNKRMSRNNLNNGSNRPYVDDDDTFDNVPIKSVAYNATPSLTNDENNNAATSLLNPYRNNKFYNNESRTINGGFKVNDEFGPNELRPRYIQDPAAAAAEQKPKGWLMWRGKRVPIWCYILTLIQTIVFIVELAKMGSFTGSPVQTKPYFNPMIGPSNYVQINMGSRFVPCMIYIDNITSITSNVFPCPNSTDTSTGCTLDTLCGLGGLSQDDNGYKPNQWYRIITPIFLHAGFIHIICNLLLQMMLGVDMERAIGSIKFIVIYMAAGISGNIFGANFAQSGLSSTGASGALFGIIGVNLVHFLFFTNKSQMHPKTYRKNLSYLIFEIIFTLVLGLLPGLDNFSHIGGFIVGVLLSVVLFKDPNFIFQERYRYQRDPKELNKSAIPARNSLNSFTPFDYDGGDNRANEFTNIRVINSKFGKFFPNLQIRKTPVFFGWVAVRLVCVVLTFLWFYLLSVNFFTNGGGHCSWCKYLSCIPVKDWCTMGKIQLENLSSSSNASILVVSYFMFLISAHFKIMSSKLDTKKSIKID